MCVLNEGQAKCSTRTRLMDLEDKSSCIEPYNYVEEKSWNLIIGLLSQKKGRTTKGVNEYHNSPYASNGQKRGRSARVCKNW
jgi:hypothetical protein